MKYKNPYYRRIRKSNPMLVSCGYCKTEVAEYQKVGKGGLIRMHIERIIKSAVPITEETGALKCPNCEEILGARMNLNRSDEEVFNMVRSAFNTKWI